MKQRTNLRMILIFCIMVLATLLIGSTKVEASTTQYYVTTEKGQMTQEIISKIPSTFTVNVKWIDYKQSDKLIVEQIANILKADGVSAEVVSSKDYNHPEDKDYIWVWSYGADIRTVDINGQNVSNQNTITVTYSNSTDYNETDKKYVDNFLKNLQLPNDEGNQYDISQYSELGTENYQDYFKIIQDTVKDNSIQLVKGEGASGWGGIFSHGGDFRIDVFKNNVYYGYIYGKQHLCYKITIPSNIEDTETAYMNYAIPKIEQYLQGLDENSGYEPITGKVTLKKERDNFYNVYIDGKLLDDEPYKLLIKKADNSTSSNTGNTGNTGTTETKPITKEDKTTGIKIEAQVGSISANITISSNKVTDQAIINKVAEALKNISNEYVTYDISLLENGTKVQPNGKIKVSIPIPSGYDTSKLVVYRITDSGEKIEYKPTVSNNYAVFETDHFSTYVLAEKETSSNSNTTTSNSNKLDETPKTGVNNIVLVSSAIVSIISLAGIIIIKRK